MININYNAVILYTENITFKKLLLLIKYLTNDEN